MRWIVGDIHGMLRPLEKLLAEIDRRDPKPQLIFCGDYVNRGPDSRHVVDLLLQRPRAAFCRGNHDDTFDLLLNGECYISANQAGGIVTTFEHFLKYGLDRTLASYGVEWDAILKASRSLTPDTLAELLAPVPASHRQFFRNLVPVHEEADFFVAHAKWDVTEIPGIPTFELQLAQSVRLRYDVIWGRFTADEIQQPKPWPIHGFFGHTPVTVYRRTDDILPLHGDMVTLLDTAAALSPDGRMTAWCFEESAYLQSDREGTRIRDGRKKAK